MEKLREEIISANNKNDGIDIDSAANKLSNNLGATSTKYGDSLLVEYSNSKYLIDKDGNIVYFDDKQETKANKPELSGGMIPIKYNQTKGKWIICSEDDTEWYDYSTTAKKWANIMLSDGKYKQNSAVGTEVEEKDLGSMFVWIPRYAYTITSGYHETSGSLDVVWLSGKSYIYVDNNGDICVAKNGNEEGVTTNNAGYYVAHPAFTDGNKYNSFDNGEWRSEITGIWVSKFEAGLPTTNEDVSETVNIKSSSSDSVSGSTLYYPVFKGGKYAYNWVSASQCYDLSLTLDDAGNPYGLSSFSNSHLMKNSEWGAVTYLSISKYGASGGNTNTPIYQNNLSLIISGSVNSGVKNINYSDNSKYITSITGYSASNYASGGNWLATEENYWNGKNPLEVLGTTVSGRLTSYRWNNLENNNGTKASTTGNIYGIYDMSGCLFKYTASYINASGVQFLSNSGGSFAKGKSTYLATAYPYQIDNSVTYITDYKDVNSTYPSFYKIFGDAIWETSSGIGANMGWFNQNLEDDESTQEVFLIRGGIWVNIAHVGLIALGDNRGGATQSYGFISVLVVE